ncbi:MAG: conjugal transfer protein TrbJ [Verrucomicrobia bacterium]|nr:conjugal transfer protein TrbJ [Verrucomicrobiota bacterium]
MNTRTLLLLVALMLVATLPRTSPGNWPVIDASNLTQNTTTALKTVAMAAQQVQQYQTQLLQYKNQLLNTTGIAPALQVWQQSQQVMNQLTSLTSIFRNGSSLQNTLSQFENVNYWLNTPVTSYPKQPAGNVLETQSNAAMFQGLAKQTQLIQQDAATLERLQSTASGAQGQMQALSAANELAALEQQQLLQIRALLVQEQQALAARNATSTNSDAMRAAATQQYYRTHLAPEANQGW